MALLHGRYWCSVLQPVAFPNDLKSPSIRKSRTAGGERAGLSPQKLATKTSELTCGLPRGCGLRSGAVMSGHTTSTTALLAPRSQKSGSFVQHGKSPSRLKVTPATKRQELRSPLLLFNAPDSAGSPELRARQTPGAAQHSPLPKKDLNLAKHNGGA